jgi:uncharacterized membrane protein YbhN (UPF0104 family)
MKKRILTILQYLIFLGFGIFLAWLSLKDINRDQRREIENSIAHARYWLVVPVFAVLLLAHFMRAMRWKLLIRSLGYHPKIQNTFFAVLIGYLTNLGVPRLGEVLKCTLLARYEKIPADKLIGTIILERLIDALTLILVLFITMVIQPTIYTDLINAFFHHSHERHKRKIAGWILALIIIGIIAAGIFLWMIIKKKTIADVGAFLKRIGRSVWQGISAVQHLRNRGIFLFYSASIWFLYLFAGYLGFYAFQETQAHGYGYKEAFSILSAGSIGMTIMPGGIGAYPLLIEKTMWIYGLEEGVSKAFGWILWIVQTAVILLGGIISFVLLPTFNRKKTLTPETA